LGLSSAIAEALGRKQTRLLKEMKFFVSFAWHYDPRRIISEMRVKNKNIPYVYTSRPEIEKFVNQTEWEPNTLVETEQQDLSVIVSQTTTPQAPKEKRPRQDVSPSVTEVSFEEFQLHTKRPKTSPAPDTAGEKGIQSTTTLEVDQFLLTTRSKQIRTTVLPRKPTDTPPASQPSKIGPKLSIFEKYDLIKRKIRHADQQHVCLVLEANIHCTTSTIVCIRH
jgi:hypothetical protein